MSGLSFRGAALTAVAMGLLLSGCGQKNGGATAAPTSQCTGNTCTVTFPAVFRNNQGSTGGPGTTVLGVDAQLFSMGQGQALMRVNGQSVTIAQGASQTVGDLTVKAVTLAETSAVITFTKGVSKRLATPKPTAKAKKKA
jgi:hypothetical protein